MKVVKTFLYELCQNICEHSHMSAIEHSDVDSLVLFTRMSYVMSGQVRVFNMHIQAGCCRARLSWAQVPAFASSSVRDRKMSYVNYINIYAYMMYVLSDLCQHKLVSFMSYKD